MKVIGHRGARLEAPENTLLGFAHANRLGVEGVEFDVRLSRDNHPIVIHDATVDRTTNGSGTVADLTLSELAQLDARGTFTDWPSPAGVPSLSEVLRIVESRLHLMIEIKTDSPEREEQIARGITRELQLHPRTGGVTITSNDPVALEIVALVAPDQRRGYIGTWDSMDFLETALRLGCLQADMRRSTSSAEMVAEAQERGISVTGWMCNSVEDLELLAGWGVDFICTDNPSAMLELLAGRTDV